MSPSCPSENLVLDNVTVTYDRHPAIHHISGQFQLGSMTAIVGPNGAGKSTLLKAIMGMLPISQGTITRLPRTSMAYLPQAMEINTDIPMTVNDVVMMGAWRDIGILSRCPPEVRHRMQEALTAVGLDGFQNRMVNTLSSGQFQRVLFARLMMQDAPVILMDEPFTAVDRRTTLDMLTLIQRWHGEGRTIIAVLHDYDQVRTCFPQTLLLARTLMGWGITQDVLTETNLQATQSMMEAWEEQAALCRR
jgi:zinc/manganese transport system ATP-binding protein